MTREEYLDLLRSHAAEAGGSIGMDSFCRATRLPEKHFLRFGFNTWNAAVEAANLPLLSFSRSKTSDSEVIEAFVGLAIRLKKWPTENEMVVERQRSQTFPSLKVMRRLSRSGELPRLVAAYCDGKTDLAEVARLAATRAVPEKVAPTERAHVEGYVYMMRSGRRYKIGFTTSPSRRHREVRLDLPDPTNLVHAIPTDDPPGIERYWHRRFEAKQVRDTEFFELDASDVRAFKARKYQ